MDAATESDKFVGKAPKTDKKKAPMSDKRQNCHFLSEMRQKCKINNYLPKQKDLSQ
jgi:hypothetical protein